MPKCKHCGIESGICDCYTFVRKYELKALESNLLKIVKIVFDEEYLESEKDYEDWIVRLKTLIKQLEAE